MLPAGVVEKTAADAAETEGALVRLVAAGILLCGPSGVLQPGPCPLVAHKQVKPGARRKRVRRH